MTYNVIAVDIANQETTLATTRTANGAAKQAKTFAEQNNGDLVYIQWRRASDGQVGYYNPDGNHAITGTAW